MKIKQLQKKTIKELADDFQKILSDGDEPAYEAWIGTLFEELIKLEEQNKTLREKLAKVFKLLVEEEL